MRTRRSDPMQPARLACPICQEDGITGEHIKLAAASQVASCGHRFCTQCIEKWAASCSSCPLCKQDSGVLVAAASRLVQWALPRYAVSCCRRWALCCRSHIARQEAFFIACLTIEFVGRQVLHQRNDDLFRHGSWTSLSAH
eukprot:s2048_g8.t1